MPSLAPQAALEQAVVNALIAQADRTATDCGRSFDGRPPPKCGPSYVAVWSGGGHRTDRGDRQAMDRSYKVSVTATLRVSQPFDRKLKHRDDLEALMDVVTAIVHNDGWAMSIRKAANDLAGRRDPAGTPDGRPPGFTQALGWETTDDVREVAGEWFWAGSSKEAGVTQVAHFGKARLIQYQLGVA